MKCYKRQNMQIMLVYYPPSPNKPGDMKEPPKYPSITIHKDKDRLKKYIAELKVWVKMSGVNTKNQDNMIQYHTFQKSPEYFKDLHL